MAQQSEAAPKIVTIDNPETFSSDTNIYKLILNADLTIEDGVTLTLRHLTTNEHTINAPEGCHIEHRTQYNSRKLASVFEMKTTNGCTIMSDTVYPKSTTGEDDITHFISCVPGDTLDWAAADF